VYIEECDADGYFDGDLLILQKGQLDEETAMQPGVCSAVLECSGSAVVASLRSPSAARLWRETTTTMLLNKAAGCGIASFCAGMCLCVCVCH